MELHEYQERAKQTAVYPQERALEYLALGLVGEAGEVANKVKKMIRDGDVPEFAISQELGDVLWYVAMLAKELGFTLETIAWDNIEKLAERKQRGTLKGSGDNR
jgi:NTP pyrophosphatase (non-canonical NTP hydrolase)